MITEISGPRGEGDGVPNMRSAGDVAAMSDPLSDCVLCVLGLGAAGAGLLGFLFGYVSEELLARERPAAAAAAGGGGGALRVGVRGGVFKGRPVDGPEGMVEALCLCSWRSLALCRRFLKASKVL